MEKTKTYRTRRALPKSWHQLPWISHKCACSKKESTLNSINQAEGSTPIACEDKFKRKKNKKQNISANKAYQNNQFFGFICPHEAIAVNQGKKSLPIFPLDKAPKCIWGKRIIFFYFWLSLLKNEIASSKDGQKSRHNNYDTNCYHRNN